MTADNVDFYEIKGLKVVYIANGAENIITSSKDINFESFITFDKGRNWEHLSLPKVLN
jgi:hypothetical protein